MISDILARYKTDKVNPHTYGGTYDSLFKEFDRNDRLNILEIGTQKGGSLCAWKDYFPNSNVTGLDIVDVVLPEYRRPDINYVICDINEFKTREMYDIIIDDGSHWLKDVVHSVVLLSKHLKLGGVMIIEDVQNSKTWLPTIRTLVSTQLEYNQGFRWLVGVYNGSEEGLEDNFLIILKRDV